MIEEPKRDIIGEKILAIRLSGVPKAPISTTDTITIVTLPSIIALSAFLKPLSIAPSMVLPFLNSSLILSEAITLQSTPTPIERIIPAIPGIVRVKLSVFGKKPEIQAIVPAS